MKRLLFIFVTALGILTLFGLGLSILLAIPTTHKKLSYTATRLSDSRDGGEWTVRVPVGIWRRDSTYGYSHIPLKKGFHINRDFSVAYTIGVEGERVIPSPAASAGRIIFLGGSFTFGEGVEDHQTFPYLLSQRWEDWTVLNSAVMGWGTSHAYLKLTEQMNVLPPPTIVFYVMIPHHIKRNYIRKQWVEVMAAYDRGHPHFEIVNDLPVFQKIIGVDEALPLTPELEMKERRITKALLSTMGKTCREQNVRFVLVCLLKPPPPDIMETVRAEGIELIDLSGIIIEGFPWDPHPNVQDHGHIADALFETFEF